MLRIQRSPPPQITQALSDSNIPQAITSSPYDDANITTRHSNKRPRTCCSPGAELQDLKKEILDLLKKSTDTQGSKYDQILTSLNELREENKELSRSVKFISSKYDDIQSKLAESEEERKQQLKYIRALEDKIESIERGQKSAGIELRNIPKVNARETKEDLVKIVEKMSSVLNCNVQKRDIREVLRVSTKSDTHKPVIVEFTSCLTKENIMDSLKKFNKDHKNGKLNTSHLAIDGPPAPVYISETLTTYARRLYYLSRNFAKDNDYAFCWTSHGRVYLRKAEGIKQIRIDHENDLKKLNAE